MGGRTTSRLIVIAALLLCTPAYADGYADNIKIVRVAVETGGIAYLKTSYVGTLPGAPSCASSGAWQLVFAIGTPVGQALLAAALTAKAGDILSRVAGAGTCNIRGDIEDAVLVDLK